MRVLAGALCHYTRAETAFAHILPKQSLRLSPYALMRDPLENRELSFRSDASETDEEWLSHLAWYMHLVRNRMTLLSLTADAKAGYQRRDEPYMRGWARASLWEQYADNHTGVCLVFDRDAILHNVLGHLTGAGGVTGANRVEYLPRGFADTPTAVVRRDQLNIHDPAELAQFVLDRQHDLFFVKALDWRSEHEFRVVHSPPEPTADGYVAVPFEVTSLRAVLIGEKFEDLRVPGARQMCDRLGVPLLQVQWRSGLPTPAPPD